MISRRHFIHHSILNATVLALAIGLGAVLVLTKCSGPQSAVPSGGNAAAGVAHVQGIQLTRRNK